MTIQQLQQYPMGKRGLKIIDIKRKVFYLNGISSPDTFELCEIKNGREIARLVGEEENIITPILYPLSALTQEIEVYGERFVPIERIRKVYPEVSFYLNTIVFKDKWDADVEMEVDIYPYWLIQLLQSWFINYQGIEAVSPFDLNENPYK